MRIKFYSNIFITLIMLSVSNVKAAEAWEPNSIPHTFYMSNNTVPSGLFNGNSTRASIINEIYKWNRNQSLGVMINVVLRDLSNEHPFDDNGIDDIRFDLWDNENFPAAAAGRTRGDVDGSICVQSPSGCLPKILEISIWTNPNWNWYIGTTPNNCVGMLSIDTTIRHELGHGLGLDHFGASNTMAIGRSPCVYRDLKNRDIKGLKKLYYGKANVTINIQSPVEGVGLIVNQENVFSANIAPLFNASLSSSDIKEAEDDLIWTSSQDGIVAIGNNVRPQIHLSEGHHDLTVTVGQPGEAIFGEEFSSFYIIDSVSDIIDIYGNQIAAPFPCPRRVNSPTGSCFFTVKQHISFGNCIFTVKQSNRYAEDLPENVGVGFGHRFTSYLERFPSCDNQHPFAHYYYDIGAWIRGINSPNKVNYHLYNSTKKNGQTIESVFHYFYSVPLVDAEIFVYPVDDCIVSNVNEKCNVDIIYEDKFFLPDAGLFYRIVGETSWILLSYLSEGNSGVINTGNIIGTEGIEFAVFQYANNIYRPDAPFPSNPMIRAPDGIVAGVFSVKANVPDIYEPDDSILSNNNVIGLNKPKQHHTFVDDSVDWIKIKDLSFNQELNLSGADCSNLSCNVELSNISSGLDLCIQFHKDGPSSQMSCGLSDGVFTDANFIVENTVSGTYPSQCDSNYQLGWSHIKMTDNDNLPNADKQYDVRLNCIYVPDNSPDQYENDDTASLTTNVMGVNVIKQHHNFFDDGVDYIKLPTLDTVIADLGIDPNHSCDNLSCSVEFTNLINVDLCTLDFRSNIGPLVTVGECSTEDGFTELHIYNTSVSNQDCSTYTIDSDLLRMGSRNSVTGENKSYDVELICTNN